MTWTPCWIGAIWLGILNVLKGGNVKPDYALVHEYEMLGRQINDAIDYTVSGFTEKREALRRCLHDQFIQEVVYGIQQ